MARKTDATLLDDVAQRLRRGVSVGEITASTGVSRSVIYRLSKELKIPQHGNVVNLPVVEVVTRYQLGESEKSLANRFGVARNVIRRHLRIADVPARGRSEAMFVRMLRTSPEDRAKLAEAAQNAVRGRRRGTRELEQRAITRQRTKQYVGFAEKELAEMLTNREIQFDQEVASGQYNVDFVLGSVAVEIDRTDRVKGNPGTREKVKPLLERGYWVFHITTTRRMRLDAIVIDQLVTFRDRAQSAPACRSEYRVVRGSGDLVAVVECDRDEIADIVLP